MLDTFKRSLTKGIGRKDAMKAAVAVIVLFVIVAVGYAFFNRFHSARRLAEVRKGDLEAFTRLASEYLGKRTAHDMLSRRAMVPAGGRSLVALVEEMGAEAGVGDRITSLKPVSEKETLGYTIRSVEVKLERLDLNGLVNLLYMIEGNRRLFVIDEFTVKSRFDDPKLVDVRLKIRHLYKGRA